MEKLTVSSSPHLRHSDTTAGIMLDVIIALCPAAIYGCILFGLKAAAILLVCIVTAVLAEFVWNKALKKTNSTGDFSAVVTGLLLGMNLPSTVPLWVAAIGSVVAIIVVKQMFGGIGHNFANPAIAGLFRTLPDKVSIKNLKITTGNDYVRIIPGTHLECSVGYSFRAPLAFGPELALGFEYELDELELDLEEVGITSARMAFDIVNTIPLALDLGVTALDESGNPSADIAVEVDGNLGAGTLDAPSTSTISITLKSKGKGINLNGLRLMMQASCPASHQGKVINRNQGIAIRNLKVSLPEGISIDLDEMNDDVLYE